MRRRLKQSFDFCRWTLYLTIVLAALFLLLCRIVINQLYFYQSQIESFLSDALLTPVRAESAEGVWDTLYPLIELENLRLGVDPENPGLQAEFVRAVPDYLQSIRLQTAIWEELYIQNLSIELSQTQAGGWTIAGISAGNGNAGQNVSSSAARKLADMLFRSRQIDIQNLSLDYQFEDGRALSMRFSEMRADNEDGFHRLSLKGQVDGDENGIEVILELGGSGFQFDRLEGKGYLALSGADMGNLFATIFNGYVARNEESPILAEGEFWFDISPGAEIEMSGETTLTNIYLEGQEGALGLRTNLWGQRSSLGEWRFDLVDFDMSLGEVILEPLQLSMRKEENGYRFLSERIAISELNDKVLSTSLFPDSLHQILDTLSPSGFLSSASILVSEDAQNNLQWHLEGNLESVSALAWQRAPSVENISGYFVADSFGGELLIDSADAQVHFERLFAEGMVADEIKGQVGWRIDRQAGEIHLYSGPMRLSRGDSTLNSQFHFSTGIERRSRPTHFTLVNGIQNEDLRSWRQFLPRGDSDDLANWFQESDLEGVLSSGGFVYRGTYGLTEDAREAVQLIAQIEKTGFSFSSEWPKVSAIEGSFGIANNWFYSSTDNMLLGQIPIENVTAEIGISNTPMLFTSLQINQDAGDLLEGLAGTPVGSFIEENLSSAELSGALELDFRMQQPIKNDLSFADLDIEASAYFSEASLLIKPLNLRLDSIIGTLEYDEAGFSSPRFLAKLWDRQVTGSVASQDRSSPIEGATVVDLATEIDLADLQTWLGDPTLDSLTGVVETNSRLVFSGEEVPRLDFRLTSDTLGLTSRMPVPLAKVAADSRPLELNASLDSQEGTSIDLSFGEALKFRYDLNSQGDPSQGVFAISSAMPEPQQGKFKGVIHLEEFDYRQWQPLVNAEGSDSGLVADIVLESSATLVGDTNLGAVSARLSQLQDNFYLDFASSFGEGQYIFSALSEASPPHQLSLNWFDMRQISDLAKDSEAAKESQIEGLVETNSETIEEPNLQLDSDLIGDLDPRKFPAMEVDIAKLRYGEADWGTWHFEIQPHDLGASLSNIYSDFASSRIEQGGETRFDWGFNGQEHISNLNLELDFGDIGDIFVLAGEPKAVSSEQGSLEAQLSWYGLPWQPKLNELGGELSLALDEGSFDAEAEGEELLKLIALFSIDNWSRRLKFDFSDITDGGTGYDSFRGNFGIQDGMINTLEPVRISLTSGRLTFDGAIDMNESQVDADLVATLPVRNNMAWVTAAAVGLPAGVGVWLFTELFKDELDSMASITYRVTGDIESPEVDAETAEDVVTADSEESLDSNQDDSLQPEMPETESI